MPSDRPGLLAELKRRNVLRAAALYIAAVWALAQGISQLSGPLGLANRVTVWFLIACAIGFPLWLAFAWFYEFTPHGFKRDEEVAQDAPLRQSNARRLNVGIIAILAVAVVLLASGYFVRRHASARTSKDIAGAAPTTFNPPPGTLAVLPFQNLSDDPRQRYFSDGITEELTDALGQNAALRVIAWDTASRYRNSSEGPQAIGKALNVANLLHGSIQREGDQVRVVVELVNTLTGTQIWSNHYDDTLANVFQVQDRISASIAEALKVKFAAARSAQTVNPQAHDLVLQARALIQKAKTAAPLEQARKLYEQAIALDPGYAGAHAGLAQVWLELAQFSTVSLKDALPTARAEAHKALALDPRNVAAVGVLGSADEEDNHITQAKARFEQALALDPSDSGAHLDYANVLPLKQALAQELEAVQLDPDDVGVLNNLAGYELDSGEYPQALASAQALMRLDPHSADNAFGLAEAYVLLHRNQDAAKAFDLAKPDSELGKALVAAGRLTYQSLLDPGLYTGALAAVDALRRRTDLDPFSMGDVTQLYLALDQNATALALLSQSCAASPAGCNDLSVNPMWIALRGAPHFQALVKQYDTVSRPEPASS